MIRRARYGSVQSREIAYGYRSDATRLFAATTNPRGGSNVRGSYSKGMYPAQSSSPEPDTGRRPSARGRIGMDPDAV